MSATTWFTDVVKRRPAESATAFTGALGLLVAQLVGAGDDLQMGLIVLLAALPGAVSFLYDSGPGSGEARIRNAELTRELDGLALRAARRARLGLPGWDCDLNAATKLRQLQELLHPAPGAAKAEEAPADKPKKAAGPADGTPTGQTG